MGDPTSGMILTLPLCGRHSEIRGGGVLLVVSNGRSFLGEKVEVTVVALIEKVTVRAGQPARR